MLNTFKGFFSLLIAVMVIAWVVKGTGALDPAPDYQAGIETIVQAVESGDAADFMLERYQKKMAEGGVIK